MAEFIELGFRASWWPNAVFGPDGCAPLTGWRERAFHRLADAELSEERTAMLVVSWGAALELCTNPRLEQWFFDRLARALNTGEDASLYWRALGEADSPRIRAHLLGMMNDPGLQVLPRSIAATVYFQRFEGEVLLRESIPVFESRSFPGEAGYVVAMKLMRWDADRLFNTLGGLVRSRPELADQYTFHAIAHAGPTQVSQAARDRLAGQLQRGLAERPLADERQRERVHGTLELLQRPRPDNRLPVRR